MTINTSTTEITSAFLPYSLSSEVLEESTGLPLPRQAAETGITPSVLPSVESNFALPSFVELSGADSFLSNSAFLSQSVQPESDGSTDITGLSDILLIDESDSITNGGLAVGEQLVVSGAVDEAISLTFNWTGRDAAFNNEFGVFKVDELGTVDGVEVGDAQYTASALASASRQVIFSSDQTVGNTQTLTFQSGDRLAFYLVQDRSTEEWLAQNENGTAQTLSPVFFSLNDANADSVDHVKTQLLADGLWEFAWEDLLGGGDQDFNDAVLTVSKGPGILEKTPGTAGQTVRAQFSWTGREAFYGNEMGLYLVDDHEGRIDGLSPGDDGYALAALSDSRRRIVFERGETVGAETKLELPGDTYFGWYLIQDSSSQLFLDQNPDNQSDKVPLAFFSLGGANPDEHFHLERQSAGGYGWEDLFEGGDRDFNDLVFKYEFEGTQEPTAPTLQASLANDTGSSDTDQITSDPTIQGSVLGSRTITALRGGFGDTATADFIDITASLQGSTFTLDQSTLAAINGGTLPDEEYTLRLAATNDTDEESEVFEIGFVLDTTVQNQIRLSDEFDSGTVGDRVTSFEVVTLVGEAEPNVELALQGSALTATSDDDGSYSFPNISLSIGENTFTVVATDVAGNQLAATTIITRTPVDTNAPVVQAALVNDTGVSDTDGVTSDAAIQGSVTSNTDVASLRAGFNDTPATEFVDISDALQGDTFTLSEEVLANINGGALPDGEYRLKLIAANVAGSESEVIELPFLLDTVIQSPTLQLASSYDSETVGDLRTSFTEVRLEGSTDADARIDLQSADMVTASDRSGNFALRNVDLGEGDNDFVVQATDAAGNQADGSLTISKTQRQALRNNAPVITSTPSTSLPTDSSTYQYQVTATDEDNDPLVYSLANGPAGASISEQGLLSWTVESDDSSSYDFAVQVDDGQGGIATQNFAVGVPVPTGEINGFVWNDLNRNGVFDQFQSGSDSEIEPSSELEVEPNFDDVYDVFDLGSVPGLPTSYGGLTLNPDNLNQLLIGGNANREDGAIYAVDVVRGAGNHIIGFEGSATQYGEGAYNDGGLQFNDEGVLFASRWPENELGQSLPGSRTTDKIIDLAPLGIAQSHASLSFVPEGIPGEGGLKFVSWAGGQWYDVELAPDGNGTYDIANVSLGTNPARWTRGYCLRTRRFTTFR